MKFSCMKNTVLVGCLLTAIGGCTTTYIGQKIEPNGKLSKPSGGVPFVMTRPEYMLNITPDSTEPTKAVYTLAANYVPDASQRFTIALDPGLFVNGKFDLDFGDNGNLAGSTSTTTSKVIETFGSFVGAAIKVSALLDAGDTLVAYKAALKANGDSRCDGAALGGKGTVKDELTAVIQDLEVEAEREIGDKTNAKRLRAELVGERLHYLNASQRDCMTAVVEEVKAKQEDPSEKKYTADLKSLESAAKDRNVSMTLLQGLS